MTLTLAHAAGSVVVDAPEPERRWLAAFLAPAYRVAPDAEDGSVRVSLAAPLTTTPRCRDADRVAFVLDRRPSRLAVSEVAGGTMCVDPELHVAYAVAEDGRHTAVHRGPRDGLTRIALMRVVREHAHNALVDRGGLVLHAAAFAGPRGAVILAGRKGAGKTTLLARMLSETGMTYLANDRVGVDADGREALAIPTIVAVRPGSRRLLPDLGERLASLEPFTGLEASNGNPVQHASESWHCAPGQLAGAISCGMRGAAPLAAFVALRPDAPPRLLRQLSSDAAAEVLFDGLLGARSGVYVSEIFRAQAPPERLRDRLRAACHRLASVVPGFEVSAPVSLDATTIEALSALCR